MNKINSKKKILFCGNVYGAGNIGDDAILEGLVENLRSVEDNIGIGAISMNPAHTKSTINIDYVWDNTLKSEHEAINWATHIILGGGTLLTDSQNIRYPLKHCCRIIDHAINYKKPISMLAAGVSDINRTIARGLLKKHFNKYLDVITIRSEFDKQQAIKDGGMNTDIIKVAADGAFCLDISVKWQPQNIIGLSLVNEGREHIGYPQRVANAINKFQTVNPDFKYMGICSEVRKKPEFDYQLIKKTFEMIDGTWPIQDDYKSPQEFIKFLSQFNFVFTMRMHILVFCCLCGIPCITMVREQKLKNMLNSLGIKHYLTMDSPEKDIFNSLQMAINEPEKFLPNQTKLNNLKSNAKNNAVFWNNIYKSETTPKTFKANATSKYKAILNTSIVLNKIRAYIGNIKFHVKKIFIKYAQ